MSVAWTIGGIPLAELGLKVARGTFRIGAASEMVLTRTGPFDASPLFAYGAAVTLARDGTPYFTGKVRSRPAFASSASEGQQIVIRDAWEELEKTIYLEPWSVGAGAFDFPIAMLGLNDEGVPIATGTQIIEALNMAITAGVNLQVGSVPTGIVLWPSEVRNVAVAEVIRMSCRLHPDWIPWIDHTTAPPTLNITPAASLTGSSGSVSPASANVESFRFERLDDLVPAAVRITYTNATIIDGVTYRDGILDHYPPAGPESGPGVLSAVIDLAGGQMQFQKSRIQTATIPTESGSDAKDFLKVEFPALAELPDGAWSVVSWNRTLVADPAEAHPPPVNPEAERLEVADVDDLPRKLVRGTIEDWMRKKVGKILITAGIKIEDAATAAEMKTLLSVADALKKGFTVVATNAVTKIYKGVTQWVAPEAAPEGIAQAVYDGLSAYQFEGSATIKAADVTATRFHGTKFNLTGGGALATMNAVVRSASFDVEAGTVDVSCGPSAALAAEDFLELQHLFRGRMPNWMFEDERTSNELGAEFEAGSRGDTVSGYDQPETKPAMPGGGAGSGLPGATIVPERFKEDEGDWKVVFTPAVLWEISFVNAGLAHEILATGGNLTARPELALEEGENEVWIKWDVAVNGTVSGNVQLVIGSAPTATKLKPTRPNGGTVGVHIQKLGTITVSEDEGVEPEWTPHAPHVTAHCLVNRIEHTGDGFQTWHSWTDGLDKWRTLRQVGEFGAAIISTTPETLTDTIDFRKIRGRLSLPQINVTEEGDEIEVKGNGVEGTISGATKVTISVKDGLVTAMSADEIGGTGVHANVQIYLSAFDAEGKLNNPDYGPIGLLKFRFGQLVYVEWDSTTWGTDPSDTGIDPGDIPLLRVNRNFVPS